MLRTPFYQYHVDNGGKMVDFAGWEMPLRFGLIHEEHRHVRNAVGSFDVSHMGRIKFSGRHARRFLERVCTRRVSDMKENRCRYSLICNEEGGVKDDVLVYRFEDYWMLVVNASNRLKLLEHFEVVKGELTVKIEDQTESTGMIAVQGPGAMAFVGNFSSEIPALKRYAFTVKNLLIMKMIVSRTGYTGEDGIEIILPAKGVGMAMKLLGKEDVESKAVLRPIGLGARDTLRMEAGMPLYGHELREERDAISSGLSFAISLDKGEEAEGIDSERFVGQAALKEIAAKGAGQRLVGMRLEGKRTARGDMKILDKDGGVIGVVTSGCFGPTVGYPIAMGYVNVGKNEVGGRVVVDMGRGNAEGEIVSLPFYKRG